MDFNWKDVVEEGVLPGISTPQDYQKNYAKGLAEMYAKLENLPAPITAPTDLKELHKLLFEHVSPWAGKFHWKQHLIGGTPGSDPEMRERELDLLGKQMAMLAKIETNEQNVIRIAAFYHIRLVTCHVFPDGNGRVTRALCDHYLQTRLQKQMEQPFEKRPYLDALKASRENENLAPLANVLSQAWIGLPEKETNLPSPFRLTPLQMEPLKKSWIEETARKVRWIEKNSRPLPQRTPDPTMG